MYEDGDELFPISSTYWSAYYTTDSGSSWSSATLSGGYYIGVGSATGTGVMFVSKETINAALINNLYLTYNLYDTHTVSESVAQQYTGYCSVATSATSNITNDSGVASWNEGTANGGYNSNYRQYMHINLSGCTRTGYLKYAMICTKNGRSADSMRLSFYSLVIDNTSTSGVTVT